MLGSTLTYSRFTTTVVTQRRHLMFRSVTAASKIHKLHIPGFIYRPTLNAKYKIVIQVIDSYS